jgi:uncharacterized protein (DUF2147 family)
MRRGLQFAALAGFAAIALASAPAHATLPVTGLWSLGEGKARISISECGETLCGRIVDAAKIQANPDIADKKNKNPLLRLRKLKGLLILTGFVGGPSEWKGGTIYNPDDGGTYRATIRMVDEYTLKVTGCIVRPLCKSAKLTRDSGHEATELSIESGFSVAKR